MSSVCKSWNAWDTTFFWKRQLTKLLIREDWWRLQINSGDSSNSDKAKCCLMHRTDRAWLLARPRTLRLEIGTTVLSLCLKTSTTSDSILLGLNNGFVQGTQATFTVHLKSWCSTINCSLSFQNCLFHRQINK
jgi:hypothetical protein